MTPFRRLWTAIDERLHDRQVRRINRRRAHQARRPATAPVRLASGILRVPRRVALTAIAVLIGAASGVSFAESYRGLYEWAAHHGLTGIWAYAWPCQVDTFIAVGELSLFVALVDRWQARSRTAAWLVTAAGLAVSVMGNIGHVSGHSLAVRATAAVPPLAAASALAVGMGVLKRVVEKHHQENIGGAISSAVSGTGAAVPASAPVPALADAPVPALAPVPAPVSAPGYTLNGHGHEAERIFADDIAAGNVPSIRQIRAELHVGQPRAKEIQAHLETLTPAGRDIARIRDEIRQGAPPPAS
jgi:hypothetical protein